MKPRRKSSQPLCALLLCALSLLPGAFPSALAGETERAEAPKSGGPRGKGGPKAGKGQAAGPAQKNRARWGSLPPERRREIQRLYEELTRRLSAEERKLLIEKLAALDAETRKKLLAAARARLNEDPLARASSEARREILRARLNALPPKERDLLRGMAPEERLRYLAQGARGRRKILLARLAPEERARLAALPPKEQTQELWKLLGRETLRATFQDPREIEALRRLPPARLAELCRTPDLASAVRPRGIGDEAWKRWLALKPYERARCVKLILEGPAERRAKPAPPQK